MESSTAQPEGGSRLQTLLKKYGKAGLIVWVAVSIIVLFACYAALELGMDMKTLLHEWGLGDSDIAAAGGKLMMALALQKLLWPLRVALTALITPILVIYMPPESQTGTEEKTD